MLIIFVILIVIYDWPGTRQYSDLSHFYRSNQWCVVTLQKKVQEPESSEESSEEEVQQVSGGCGWCHLNSFLRRCGFCFTGS